MPDPDSNRAESPKRHALVVEDDVLVRMAIVDMLEMAGHGAEEAADGESALGCLEGNSSFDILISDVSLPGISGEELAVTVHKRWPGIRIVLVSGRDRITLPEFMKQVSFLPKPFQFEDLLRVVEA
jgi:DNA-binding NtrC family response regulator